MAIDSVSNYSSSIQPIQQSIASGSRINNSADDPAGQAVVTELTKQINLQDVGVRNASDGISLIQTADGVSQSISDQIGRLNELAIQSQNGTYNQAQRNIFNMEFQQGLASINQFVEQANFNGTNLLNGSTASVDIALGDSTSSVALADLTSGGLGLDGLDLSSSGNAAAALEALGLASETLGASRAQFGAQQNGLESAVSNLTNQNVNTQAARSQISDTDMARALMEMTSQQLRNEAGLAMMAQRNQNQENTLQLLQ